ncbi:hypothetical protein [Micromonospora sp. RTGN7]|uniref:hypothetical protein n=1 Tax=Micromonospora sp. RTGN7 TaxID=3016526 RepID=UPI0029FEEF33|nr:hypothetical protein [Micromonospora sp. RTGN7]
MVADENENARAALSVLTAWVTEGEDFAAQYGAQQMLGPDGAVSVEAVVAMATGNLRLAALLVYHLAIATDSTSQEVLQRLGQEIAK